MTAVREGEPAIEAMWLQHLEHPYVFGQPIAQAGIHLEDVVTPAAYRRSAPDWSHRAPRTGFRRWRPRRHSRRSPPGSARNPVDRRALRTSAGRRGPARPPTAWPRTGRTGRSRRPRPGPPSPTMSTTASMRARSSCSGGAADLHLDRVIAQVEITAHLVAQPFESAVGVVVTAGGIHRRPTCRLSSEVACDGRVGGFVVEFGVQVPAGQFQRGRGRGPVAVAAGFLVGAARTPTPRPDRSVPTRRAGLRGARPGRAGSSGRAGSRSGQTGRSSRRPPRPRVFRPG